MTLWCCLEWAEIWVHQRETVFQRMQQICNCQTCLWPETDQILQVLLYCLHWCFLASSYLPEFSLWTLDVDRNNDLWAPTVQKWIVEIIMDWFKWTYLVKQGGFTFPIRRNLINPSCQVHELDFSNLKWGFLFWNFLPLKLLPLFIFPN